MGRAMSRRTGRGRLSSLDMASDEARPFIVEAAAELRARQKPQTQILAVLNVKLAAIGVAPISKSAFNRYSLAKAFLHGSMDRAREIAADLGQPKPDDGDIGLLLNETIKTMTFDLLCGVQLGEETNSIKLMHIAAETLQFAERSGKLNAERRKMIEADFQKRAIKAVNAVAKEKGLAADTVKAIKAQILGIKDAVPKTLKDVTPATAG